MEEINNKFNAVFIILGILLLFQVFQTCTNNKNKNRYNTIIENRKESDSTFHSEIDKIYTKNETDILLKIHSAELSKNILYDWNSVVRTVVRPDDRMNEYDIEIAKLRGKLKIEGAK